VLLVFEKHKKKKAEEHYQAELHSWQQQRDHYANLLAIAESFEGEQTEEILLKPGELVFVKAINGHLIEPRRGRGHWEGGSSGFSVPVGSIGGHSIRYRTGATRGTYVQGEQVDTAIDVGSVYITNKRVIFEGARQTRECLFEKLLGIQFDSESGRTNISMSNRQKPTTIQFDVTTAIQFKFWLDLALAHYRGDTAGFVADLKQDLAELDASRPQHPTGV
jgi:hypothetical protein